MRSLKLIEKILIAFAVTVFIIYSGSFLYAMFTYKEPDRPIAEVSKETTSQISKIITTQDSGYLVAGFKSFFNETLGDYQERKVWLTKLDYGGNKIWERNLNIENAAGVQQLDDGSYILAGFSSYYNAFYIIKVTNSGRVEWKKSLDENVRDPVNIHATKDGGFVVIANMRSDIFHHYSQKSGDNVYWLAKFNQDGKREWQSLETDYQYNESAKAVAVDVDKKGGYLVAGFRTYNGRVKVININSRGRLLWKKYFEPQPEGINATVFSIKASPDGSSVFAGTNGIDVWGYEDQDSTRIWVEKIDSAGSEIWQKMIFGDRITVASEMQNTSNQGYVVIGSTSSREGYYRRNHGGTDVLIIKLRNNGSIEWQKLLGGSGSDLAAGIEVTPDKGYIIAANTTSTDGDVHSRLQINKGWMIKLDVNGEIQWEKTTDNL